MPRRTHPPNPRSVARRAFSSWLALAPPAAALTALRPLRHLGPLQARALEQALKEINSRFGKNSIMKLGAQSFGEV